jgi:hypothetical protein
MFYHDAVYGKHEINEPVLIDLLNSVAVTRLQGVLQHGISGLIGVTAPTTRYDHSVGAMLLVRRLGGTLTEQIAALLHDISHTAMSHVIDYVVDGHDDQSYHDEVKEDYVAGTDLPDILARHGYAWRPFLHEADFSLLEQPSPRLCADRLDYFLRDAADLGLASREDVARVLDALVVVNGRIAVNDTAAARWLAHTFMQADDASWANFWEVGLYEVTARAIRRGLDVGVITRQDFWLTDVPFWQKLHAGQDEELQAWLRLVSKKVDFVWDEQQPTFTVSTKIRTIDPDVVQADGTLRPLSAIDPSFAAQRADYIARKSGKWPMRVVPF